MPYRLCQAAVALTISLGGVLSPLAQGGVSYNQACRLVDLQTRPKKLQVYREIIDRFLREVLHVPPAEATVIAGQKVSEMQSQLEALDQKSANQKWHYEDNDVFYRANGGLGAELEAARRKPGDPPADFRRQDYVNDTFYEYAKRALIQAGLQKP